ncbi:hypothetical protein ACFQ8E_01570 [Isoptericola sp. NPDC056573]|uniref:hypothetical protein n=1 Tax=Isoptericola sp. NPDC056573 TaxID=3345868 RepID=UPI0036A88989
MSWPALAGRREHARRAAVLAACFVGLYAAAVVTPWGQLADDHLLGLTTSAGLLTRPVADALRTGLVVAAAGVAVVVGVVAVVRGRWWSAVTCAAVTLLSTALSVALRDVVLLRPLHDPDYGYLYNTYPSTHVTVTAALAVSIVVLWPYRTAHGRVVVRETVLGAVVVACLVNVLTFAHRPADVLGSLLLVGCVTSVAGAVDPRLVSPRTEAKFTPVAGLRGHGPT